jgi:hypothetical protein
MIDRFRKCSANWKPYIVAFANSSWQWSEWIKKFPKNRLIHKWQDKIVYYEKFQHILTV